MKELWVEKYRPKTLKEYVVRDEAQRQQIQSWIDDKAIPHLLLSGAPGVGKTTLAKVLFGELEVSSYDILEINASRENSVDTVREKINSFDIKSYIFLIDQTFCSIFLQLTHAQPVKSNKIGLFSSSEIFLPSSNSI